ncbi:2Fe-2S iron-sulfur cluster-binding protein [Bacillus sp. 03113]|uniref:2Fe-2S iron-sulfur cluster-binding protein n=1 Tax=Bacillus sp. 03113 TaxID=2578211 RepID=UPI0011445E0B|nr:2Fe-2S iron-sulfur cluster-binding protein [Bacillus sp. 03113]
MRRRSLSVGSLIPKNQIVSQKPEQELKHKQEIPTNNRKIDQKVKLKLVQNENVFEVTPVKGTKLLDAALEQGQNLNFKCRKGTCGVCTVRITDGISLLDTPNKQEQDKLKNAIADQYRLSCQAVFTTNG